MFVGRNSEMKVMGKFLEKKNGALMIYGKRKVGKTTLIKEALNKSGGEYMYYECIRGTIEENIEGIVKRLYNAGILSMVLKFESVIDLFKYIESMNRNITIVIDEYPYLKTFEDSKKVDSIFQSIIDNWITNSRLILSGSQVSMMGELLEEKNPLYGRFDSVIKLQELNYLEASEFYSAKSPYEKAAFYGIFGGSPFVNERIDSSKSLSENVKTIMLDFNSPVLLYAENVLISEFTAKKGVGAEHVLAAIGNGRKHYSEIEKYLRMDRNGNLSKLISAMISMDIIGKNYPINKMNDGKKATYENMDNLLRFYFTYIYKNRSALQMIGPDAFYEQYIEPTLTTFISFRFEVICRSFLSMQAKTGKLIGVRNIGTYYYDDPVNRKNGEFDVVAEYADGYDVFEVKYYSGMMESDDINRESAKICDISEITVRNIGFITPNGYKVKPDGYTYYDGNDIYKTDK